MCQGSEGATSGTRAAEAGGRTSRDVSEKRAFIRVQVSSSSDAGSTVVLCTVWCCGRTAFPIKLPSVCSLFALPSRRPCGPRGPALSALWGPTLCPLSCRSGHSAPTTLLTAAWCIFHSTYAHLGPLHFSLLVSTAPLLSAQRTPACFAPDPNSRRQSRRSNFDSTAFPLEFHRELRDQLHHLALEF